MCLLNYNKEKKKYKHLTYTERTMIERWYNREHISKKEIAKRWFATSSIYYLHYTWYNMVKKNWDIYEKYFLHF